MSHVLDLNILNLSSSQFYCHLFSFWLYLNNNTLKKFSSELVPLSFMGGKQVKMRGFAFFPKHSLRFPIYLNRNTVKTFSSKLVPPSFMGGKRLKMTHFLQKSFEISHIFEQEYTEKSLFQSGSPLIHGREASENEGGCHFSKKIL